MVLYTLFLTGSVHISHGVVAQRPANLKRRSTGTRTARVTVLIKQLTAIELRLQSFKLLNPPRPGPSRIIVILQVDPRPGCLPLRRAVTASASLSLPVSGTLNPSAPQLPVAQQLWDSIILVPVVPSDCGLIIYHAAVDLRY